MLIILTPGIVAVVEKESQSSAYSLNIYTSLCIVRRAFANAGRCGDEYGMGGRREVRESTGYGRRGIRAMWQVIGLSLQIMNVPHQS